MQKGGDAKVAAEDITRLLRSRWHSRLKIRGLGNYRAVGDVGTDESHPCLSLWDKRAMFALRLLGPLVLEAAGKPLSLPTTKVAALLALLALAGPTPRERIAAWLWPKQDAASSRRNLRRELARLRQIGAGDALVTRGESLALSDAVQVDSTCFAALLDAAQTDAALALWRGVPADGLSLPDAPAFDDWLSSARMRLARRRTSALEAGAAAREGSGDIDGALRAIQTLLDDDPLQEAHQRSAMRLHAAAGRRAAALAGYERFAALLSSELGLAPMADTVALMQTLRQPSGAGTGAGKSAGTGGGIHTLPTPAPRPPRTASDAGTSALPTTLPFVGRDDELAQLDAAWQHGLAMVIEGPAGIGKSRLATELAAARGAWALVPCRPGDAAEPYAAFTRALRSLAGQALATTKWPRWLRDELAHVLPELGPAPLRIDSEAARARFFDACAEAWQMLAAGSFDAVIVDDWHLADAPSRALLEHIVRRRRAQAAAESEPADQGPREIFVTRPALLPADSAAIDALVRDGAALHLRLPPLSDAAMAQLADRLAGGRAPAQLGPQLARASRGNPFVAGETLRHWVALSVLRVSDAGGWSLESSAQAAGNAQAMLLAGNAHATLLARVATLPQAAVRLLEAAALAREPFTPALLAGACALSEVQALAAIEAAMAAQLLRELEGGFAFTHDLVQAALDTQLSPERRRLVHRRLALGAEALHGRGALPAAIVAHHWEAGGEPARAVAPRLVAADAALALFEDGVAEAHWAQALADGATLPQRITITVRRASIQRNRDEQPALLASVAELHRLADEAAQHPDTATAGLQARIDAAELLTLMGGSTDALQRIDAVLETLREPGGADDGPRVARRAHALQVRSQALNVIGRPDEGTQAAELALASGGLSAQQQGRLLHSMAYGHFLRNEVPAALRCAERSLALWQSIGLRRSMARAHGNIGLMTSLLGRVADGRQAMRSALQMAEEMRMHELRREMLLNLAYLDLHEGAPQAALATLDAAWDAAETFTRQALAIVIRGMQVHAQMQRGELGIALDLADDTHQRALALGEPAPLADCVSMTLDLATDLGDFDRADALVASLPGGLAAVSAHLRTKLAFNIAHLALARGQLDEAERALAVVGPLTELVQPYDRGFAALRHAELALARADAASALAWLDRWQPETTHVEAQALMQAARLHALRLSGPPQTTQTSARTACADAAATLADARTPALAALSLRRELAAFARAAGDAATAARLGDEQQAQLQRLASTLATRPVQQAVVCARWPLLQR